MNSDLRFAIRSLLKTPGFALASLLIVALSIGVNTSMYTLVDAITFRLGPYPHSEQLVRLYDASAQTDIAPFSFQDFEEARSHSTAFSFSTAFMWWNNTLSESGASARQLNAVYATPEIFSTIGEQPLLGRAFTAEENTPGHTNVALLSYNLWQQRFGGRKDILGETVRLSAEPVTIIGVMPPQADYPELWGKVDIWRPLALLHQFVEWKAHSFHVIGRLKPGATIEQAAAELAPLADRLAKDHPETNSGHRFRLVPLGWSTMDDLGRQLTWMLFGLAGFVLLIACANLAGLQFARATARMHETAVRSALGASRWRLLRQQCTESLLLALAGGGGGLILALWLNQLIENSVIYDGVPYFNLPLNGRIIAFSFGASLLTGLLFGGLPAWLASRTDLNASLKAQTRAATSSRAQTRIRHFLIVAEIALALALLAGAGAMVRGFQSFLQRDHGWSARQLMTAIVHLPEETTYNTEDRRRAFHEKLERRLAGIPGVDHVALATELPAAAHTAYRTFEVPGQTSALQNEQPSATWTMVTHDYFSALQIPFLEGHGFAWDIKATDPAQVVVNASLAHRFWPGRSALGQQLLLGGQKAEIIGVVRDTELAGDPADNHFPYQGYRPLVQEPWGTTFAILRGPAGATLGRELPRAVADIDPDVAVDSPRTVSEVIMDSTAHDYLLIGRAIAGFAALGLGLAALGLYALIANIVAQRTNEFGIRLALGAKSTDVLGLVLGRGVRLVLAGIGLGLAGAFAVGRLLNSLMPKLDGFDATGLTVASLFLFAVSLLACWFPARRATQVDPIVALRAD